MKQKGQDKGYAMAALIIVMSVAAIMMTVAMPTWKQMSRREKEEELIFRGQQYMRAIRLYGQKFANANPPNIDVLVEQRFIRKKFKDPITNDDFLPILAGQAVPGASTPGQSGQRGGGPAAVQRGPDAPPITSGGQQAGGRGGSGRTGGPGAQGPVGGVMGVMSKSKDESIKLYNGRSHYNEWAFVYVPTVQAPGAGAPGVGAPGQRGGPGQGQQPGANPFGSGIGGERGRGGRGGPPPPGGGPGGRGFGPPTSPFQPATPIQPGRGGRGF